MSYHVLPPLVHPSNQPQPVTSLAFDPVSDAIWSGSASGSVSALYGPNTRGVAFPATVGRYVVSRVVATDKDVKALAGSGVGSWGKGGANKWYYNSESPLSTFTDHPSMANSLVLATASPLNAEFLIINSANGSLVRKIPSPPFVTHLRSSHSLLLSAASDGQIRTHDLRMGGRREEGKSISTALAHVGGIQGLEVSGNYIYTCGWGLRQSRPHADQLVKVFDIRTFRPMQPIPFSTGPSHIQVHPNSSTTLLIASAEGLVNLVDASNPSGTGEFHQLNVASYISSVAYSPTGAYIALGDGDGYIHLLTSTSEDEHIPWNGFEGHPVQWADPPDPLPDIDWTNSTPLNSVGMPFYSSPLLSGSTHMPWKSYAAPAKIPPQVLSTMRTIDFVGYASLPKDLRGKRNLASAEVTRKDEGRFRSKAGKKIDGDDVASIPTSDYQRPEIPKYLRKTDIKYSKFGIEDFDFGFYNQTSYSGLETHIMNSYTNAIIQSLFYCSPMRQHAKSHITINCRKEHCFLCEFGFVSRMLEDAKGKNCQASNFCKIIGRTSQATALGLIDYTTEGNSPDYAMMIQQFNRFMLEEMALEGSLFPNNPRLLPLQEGSDIDPLAPITLSPVTQLLGIDGTTVITCGGCGATKEKGGMGHIVDLIYPRKSLPHEAPPPPVPDFASLLSTSLTRETTYKATCQTCKNLVSFRSRKNLRDTQLPPLLSVNASVFSEDQHRHWLDTPVSASAPKNKFLTKEVSVKVAGADTQDGSDPVETEVIYDVRAMVVEIRAGPKAAHLVAIVKMPDHELEDPKGSPWYVFNDFVVQNISEEDALSFPGWWKIPCVLYLERRDVIRQLDLSGLPSKLDPAILGQRMTVSKNTNWAMQKHIPLSPPEFPKPGMVVAIDAEFVALQQEETEFRSDGTKKVIRPSQQTLARVSVLRGEGHLSGRPFIDDYIHTTDTVVDYLTEWSGIKFGDLDANLSVHTLLPLKTVYKKLRLLVDLGCIFIGHGLTKDFRIINIFVPPEQVIDTVDVYFKKERQRRISLRFLSWYILKEPIQLETHDSIEDARAALLLYKEFQRNEGEGKFDDVLDDIYQEGRKLNWKPPAAEPAPPPIPSPPITSPHSGFAIGMHVPLSPTTSFPFNSAPFGPRTESNSVPRMDQQTFLQHLYQTQQWDRGR